MLAYNIYSKKTDLKKYIWENGSNIIANFNLMTNILNTGKNIFSATGISINLNIYLIYKILFDIVCYLIWETNSQVDILILQICKMQW